jgi:ribose-phosphate pyrophosphokinase
MSIQVIYADDRVEQVDFLTYPDGNFYTKFAPEEEVVGVIFKGTTVEELARALFCVDALYHRGHSPELFVMPYIPGARQDRLNPAGDYLFSLDSVANMINERDFTVVQCCDPHSPVAKDLILNLHDHDDLDFRALFGGKYAAVIAPDKGAVLRASNVAAQLGVPVYAAGKTRNVETGALTGFVWPTEAVNGRFLIVDDICDGGGTFLGLVGEAPFLNCQVDLYVTHGLFTKGTDDLISAFGSVFAQFVYGPTPKGVRVLGDY